MDAVIVQEGRGVGMKERRDVLALWKRSLDGVLISLVRAHGSSYRRPGARLFLAKDGVTAGTISGGCLEADLLKKAPWKIKQGAAIESYDTSFDDTAEIPYGLGCGGSVDLLLEDAAAAEGVALLTAMECSLRGEERLVATVLPAAAQSYARVVVDGSGDVVFATAALATEEVVALRGVLLRATKESEAVCVDVGGVVCERLASPQRLIIFGAGEDAKPLATMAAQLGWSVVVADGRPQFARTERFPAAERVCVVNGSAELMVTPRDAVVLMTHSYEQDRRFLAELLPIAPRYLGVLGARHRSALLLSQAAQAAGISFDVACARVFAPVGLDLGGDGPEAVAIAVLAEVQGVLHGRPIASRGMSVEEALRHLPRLDAAGELLWSAGGPLCALEETLAADKK